MTNHATQTASATERIADPRLKRVDQRIGQPHLTVDFGKVVAVVQSDLPDDSPSFTAPDAASRTMATRRAQVIIDNIAHSDYQPLLRDYLDRARQRGGTCRTFSPRLSAGMTDSSAPGA